MAFPQGRVARYSRINRKLTSANATDATLIAAPGANNRIVIDFLYFNISVAGSVEFKQASGAWVDDDSILGGNFGANGGFIQGTNMEMGDNKPLIWTTTGTTPNIYVTIAYHIES